MMINSNDDMYLSFINFVFNFYDTYKRIIFSFKSRMNGVALGQKIEKKEKKIFL